MALVGLLGHSIATGHSGAKGTCAPGHSVAGHSVAGALGRRGTRLQGHLDAAPNLHIYQFNLNIIIHRWCRINNLIELVVHFPECDS